QSQNRYGRALDHRHASVAHRTSPPFTRRITLRPCSTEPSPSGMPSAALVIGTPSRLGCVVLVDEGWAARRGFATKKRALKPLLWQGDAPRTPGSWEEELPQPHIPGALVDTMRTSPRGKVG